MKLNFSQEDLVTLLHPKEVVGVSHPEIAFITIDTRSYCGESKACFMALQGSFRKGSDFLEEAYHKGIRVFIVPELPKAIFPEASYYVVESTLEALQSLAKAHREKFSFPIVAIAGKAGKTTVKEWMYDLLKFNYHVVRSPKSYNSQIGVALSLLELHPQANLALIELGFSEPDEFSRLLWMVQPSRLVITSWYQSPLDQALEEAVIALGNKSMVPTDEALLLRAAPFHEIIPFSDSYSRLSAQIAIGVASFLGVSESTLREEVPNLSRLALRLETFYGKNNTLVLNDTYHLDLATLGVSLQYMVSLSHGRPCCVYIGLDESMYVHKKSVEELISTFSPEGAFVDFPEKLPLKIPEGAMVLIKGTRKSKMERFAAKFRVKQHPTVLEINLSALRQNLVYFKSKLKPETQLLAMVKAQSYGTGIEQMASFLESQGVDYLGVAYTSEGVALRNFGITLPILVLNPDPVSYEECITNQLEPTIFTFAQLEEFLRELIVQGVQHFPIHVEIDTGMRRLGFEPEEVKSLIEQIKAQPEVRLKTVFTHFVESDNLEDKTMSQIQIERFSAVRRSILDAFSYPVLFHMANSEGIMHFPEAHFDMVRLGLGMFGISSPARAELAPVLSWKCTISQIKTVRAGESISYSRSFIAEKNTKIAILPLGYADGFSRRLSNGVGRIKVHGVWCPVIGKICMDMLMLDVSALDHVQQGDVGVVFDDVQRLLAMAESLDTIPYEIMTGISERVHRLYVRE